MATLAKVGQTRNLRFFYIAIQITGLLVLLVFGFLIHLFQNEFMFLGNVDIIVMAIVAMFLIHGITFIFETFSGKHFFMDIGSYSWVAFFIFVVVNSGGLDSQFIFLLIFPLLVAAVDLEAKRVAIISWILAVSYGSIIFFVPMNTLTPLIITKHVMITVIFSCLAYYIYKLVRETLRQKFEKEEAKKKFLELIEVDKVKNDFLSVAQHQLRTPLSSAHWALETILKEGHLNPENLELGKGIQTKIEQAISIINDMLKTIELTGKNLDPKKISMDLSLVVRDAITQLDFLRKKNQIKIVFTSPGPVLILADQKMMESLFINIIDNAFRYSAKKDVTITITANAVAKKITILVQDNGIGIKEEDLAYIFQRFYRGKNAIETNPNESGIGLYTSKRIVELHAGSIKVDSKEGAGTTVTVILPMM